VGGVRYNVVKRLGNQVWALKQEGYHQGDQGDIPLFEVVPSEATLALTVEETRTLQRQFKHWQERWLSCEMEVGLAVAWAQE